MIRRWLSLPPLVCAFVALVLAVLTLGPFMRETDQAWLLDGGMAIANGHPEIARAEFNFDKQFVSYYLPAILFKFLPRPFTADQLVLAGNIFGMILFWGALIWLLARSSRRLPLALALPVILAPTFLVYSSFYASAFTSVAFVMLLALFLERKQWGWPLRPVSFALAFLAVGARADAIFLLPLLAMLHSPQRTFVSVLKSPNTWLMAAGGLTAFFLGRALYLDHSIDYAPHGFKLKVYLGNVAFGLGGAALLLLAGLHATGLAVRVNRCKLWVAFLWLGLAMPMGYYSIQLLSPRHCTVGATSVLIFICARRGRILLQNYFRQKRFAFILKTALVMAALVPVLVGVDLSNLKKPKLTLKSPTLLPSGAGVASAGGYLTFAASVRSKNGFLDHNHAVWAAAKTTAFETNAVSNAPYQFAPIESYLIFAIRLQDKIPKRHSLVHGEFPDWFYMESRSLMRFQFAFPPGKVPMDEFFSRTLITPAAEVNWHGLTVFRVATNAAAAPSDFNAALWALNRAFGAEEFRLEKAQALQSIPLEWWIGKKLVAVSREPFDFVSAGSPLEMVDSEKFGRFYVYTIPTIQAGSILQLNHGVAEKIFVGVGAFPAWMSLQKL